MKKSTMFAIMAGAFLGAELACFDLTIKDFMFWIFLIIGSLFLNFLYSLCRE